MSQLVQIYKSRFASHNYDSKNQLMYTEWFSETEIMDSKDFKFEMEQWLEAFRNTKPRYLYDDCVKFAYPIVKEEQIWMANLLNKDWADWGLKKYAHIVPSEYVAECSVEQLFDEFFKMKLENQYPIVNFDSRKDALKWLGVD